MIDCNERIPLNPEIEEEEKGVGGEEESESVN